MENQQKTIKIYKLFRLAARLFSLLIFFLIVFGGFTVFLKSFKKYGMNTGMSPEMDPFLERQISIFKIFTIAQKILIALVIIVGSCSYLIQIITTIIYSSNPGKNKNAFILAIVGCFLPFISFFIKPIISEAVNKIEENNNQNSAIDHIFKE